MNDTLQDNPNFTLITEVNGEYSGHYKSYDKTRFYMVRDPLAEMLRNKWDLPSGVGVFVTETENASVDNRLNHYRSYWFNLEAGGRTEDFEDASELEKYLAV